MFPTCQVSPTTFRLSQNMDPMVACIRWLHSTAQVRYLGGPWFGFLVPKMFKKAIQPYDHLILYGKKNWENPEVLLSHGATPNHQSYGWPWLSTETTMVTTGDPQLVKKPHQMVSERNECTRNSALGSWMGFEICWIWISPSCYPLVMTNIAIENGDLVRGFTQL